MENKIMIVVPCSDGLFQAVAKINKETTSALAESDFCFGSYAEHCYEIDAVAATGCMPIMLYDGKEAEYGIVDIQLNEIDIQEAIEAAISAALKDWRLW